MEFFQKFLVAIGVTSAPSPPVDFITNLPIEIAQHILRMLDTHSLLNATNVSRNWLNVCTGDSQLRQSARRRLRNQRRQLQNTFILRKPKKTSQTRNTKVTISLKTRRTHDYPQTHKDFNHSSSSQTMRTKSLPKKSSTTSSNIGITRNTRLLR